MKMMKKHVFECRICGKKAVAWRSIKNNNQPNYCSNDCYRKASPKWLLRKKYSLMTENEKQEHLKKYYDRKVIKKDGCWDWKDNNKTDRYPRMDYARDEKRIPIHHYSWKMNFGDIPKGLFVCHKCDNTRCSNPEHLFLGTARDNNRDCINKNRNPKKERHGNAKLSEQKVREIRGLIELGVPITKIAIKYSVSIHTIYRVKHKKRWVD